MPRNDNTWLNLRAGLHGIFLQENHRAYTIFHDFPFPSQQTPQMITLLGRHQKTEAARQMRFGTPQSHEDCSIRLRADQDSSKAPSPILFADCEIHNPHTISHLSESNTGEILKRPLLWQNSISGEIDPTILAHMLYTKLLSPFSTLICFFADDFGGLKPLVKILALWLLNLSNRSLDLPFQAQPQIVILIRGNGRDMFDERRATKGFMRELGKESEHQLGSMSKYKSTKAKEAALDQLVQAQFGGLKVLECPTTDASSRAWRSLKSRLIEYSSRGHANRTDAQIAFSVPHFKALFHSACDHFCSDIVTPFSFVRASRIANPVSPGILSHINTLLSSVPHSQLLNFAVPVIASALMFDSYPEGMHKFHPQAVFKQLFYSIYSLKVPLEHSATIQSMQLAEAIEAAFCQSVLQLSRTGLGGLDIHKRTLARFSDSWKAIHSNSTCFSCLARMPEDTLQCRHSLCSTCTVAHSQTGEAAPWKFLISHCPLCQESNNVVFHHKPDTAGVRALIAEGGGVRGVIPLTFLKELQKAIDLPMEIQEHFDIAFGSSSGALVVLGLFYNQWNVNQCLDEFQKFSKLAFQRSTWLGLPFLKRLRSTFELFLSFTTDSRYTSRGINDALKAAFGTAAPFFRTVNNGTKVAIVTATTKDSSTCIFANYNGVAARSQDCGQSLTRKQNVSNRVVGYKLVRPTNVDEEFSVWQAARASTAAPTYFRSYQGYQDGGLGGHNNPINLALWEQDTIWSRQKKQPDSVVSLGTGFKRRLDPEEEPPEKVSFFRARCFPRLFRSLMNSFVGETRWQELQNTLMPHTRDRYHRMNIEFFGAETELDDIDTMPSLRKQAASHALSSEVIQECADNLIASLFYIELIRVPTFDRADFTCEGNIRCRIEPSHAALSVLVERLRNSRSRFTFDCDTSEQVSYGIQESNYTNVAKGERFSVPFTFSTRCLANEVDIKVHGITSKPWSISNCPYKIGTLVRDQGLDSVFGNPKRRMSQQIGERPVKRSRHVI